MILLKPKYSIEFHPIRENLALIDASARTCYKSQPKDRSHKARADFIRGLISKGHMSVIEHSILSVRFIIDRGVSHELVRHRLCAFSQESTRYCDYRGEVEFIIPPWVELEPGEYIGTWPRSKSMPTNLWADAMLIAENQYVNLRTSGWSPQQARSVLPNSLKTEIVATANYREWRHIFSLRDHIAAHPQMREIMEGLHNEMKLTVPEVFS